MINEVSITGKVLEILTNFIEGKTIAKIETVGNSTEIAYIDITNTCDATLHLLDKDVMVGVLGYLSTVNERTVVVSKRLNVVTVLDRLTDYYGNENYKYYKYD